MIRKVWRLLIYTALLLSLAGGPASTQALAPKNGVPPVYSVEILNAGGADEYRLMLDGRHFATLIDQSGTYAFRPHPGCDINGWGSTLYLQPFLPNATLTHTTIESAAGSGTGIDVSASGQVSRGAADTYGDWRSAIRYTFDPAQQTISASGVYTITLAGQLDISTGDLNLFKLASNYLDDVPLLSGGSGDTGDMAEAIVMKASGTAWFNWVPPLQPSHFPNDQTDYLSVEAVGWFNEVDTEIQGYASIAPAFKPTLKIILDSQAGDAEMRFGAIYDVAKKDHFWEDNVGITPWIASSSPNTTFAFDVTVESAALETCTGLPLVLND